MQGSSVRESILGKLSQAEEIKVTKVLRQHWNQTAYSYLERPRPDFGFMLILKGTVEFRMSGELLSARAGNLIFLPKGCLYVANFLGEVDDDLICFDFDGGDFSISAPMILYETAPFSCMSRFQALIEEEYAEGHTRLSRLGGFYLLLDAIVEGRDSENGEEERTVSRARELLQKGGEESIGEIAKACAISESGLRRLFRQRTGLSPTEYRMRMKIRQAQYLLDSTELTVEQIAERLGFFDAAYFCKVFRARVGETPRQYANGKKL